MRRLPSFHTNDSYLLLYSQLGQYPMQLVVPSAVRNAVSAATITFTASSMIRCFFIISSFLFFVTQIPQILTDFLFYQEFEN